MSTASGTDGLLRLQACSACGRVRYPATPRCASCGDTRFEWRDASGTGSVWSFCVFHKDYFPQARRTLPYAVVLVVLDEGPKLYSNLLDVAPEDIRIGMRVRAVTQTAADGTALVRFLREPETP